MQGSTVAFLFFFLIVSPLTFSSTDPVSLRYQSFQPPTELESAEGKYPFLERNKSGEGWVLVKSIISEEGVVVAAEVIDSSGSKLFEDAAVDWAMQKKFKPTMLNGEPIEGSKEEIVAFRVIPPPKAASRKFIYLFKKGFRALEKGDIASAEEVLKKMRSTRVHNLYEDAYFWFLDGLYEGEIGEIQKETQSLKRAIIFKDQYIPKDHYLRASLLLFQSQLKSNKTSQAMETYYELLKEGLGDRIPDVIHEYAQKTESLLTGDQIISFTETLEGNESSLKENLYRNSFTFQDIHGAINLVRVTCKDKSLIFNYQKDLAWKLPSQEEDCSIEVTGDPGTTFKLIMENQD